MSKPTYESYCRNEQEIEKDLELSRPFAQMMRLNNPGEGDFLEHLSIYANTQSIVNMLRHIEDRLEEIEKRLIDR